MVFWLFDVPYPYHVEAMTSQLKRSGTQQEVPGFHVLQDTIGETFQLNSTMSFYA